MLAPMILCASLCARLRMRFRPWWLEEAAPPVSFDATGGVVWEAGCALASHLLCASDAISRVRGCTVVELGSGTGLVSLAAYHAGASHVIATDLPEQLPLLCDNLRANTVDGAKVPANISHSSRIQARACSWGRHSDTQDLLRALDGRKPDFILSADTVLTRRDLSCTPCASVRTDLKAMCPHHTCACVCAHTTQISQACFCEVCVRVTQTRARARVLAGNERLRCLVLRGRCTGRR